jgi:SP family sugar:H+ symporter-like MFS transporter
MIYETKGLTLEQVDELYAEVSDARQSMTWVPTTTFREIQEGEKKVVGPVEVEIARSVESAEVK